MITRYFTPREIEIFFRNQQLEEDLCNLDALGICSIADLIDLCEAVKKRKNGISLDEFKVSFNRFASGPLNQGLVSLAELDAQKLSSMFRTSEDGSPLLWEDGLNRTTPPTFSIRCITLKKLDDSTWWADDVFEEMIDLFS